MDNLGIKLYCKICPNCQHEDIVHCNHPEDSDMHFCKFCTWTGSGKELLGLQIFHNITQSPEVLSRRLVLPIYEQGIKHWVSPLIPGIKYATQYSAIKAVHDYLVSPGHVGKSCDTCKYGELTDDDEILCRKHNSYIVVHCAYCDDFSDVEDTEQ